MSHTFSQLGPLPTNYFALPSQPGLARPALLVPILTCLRAGFPRAAVTSTRPIDAPRLGGSPARPGHRHLPPTAAVGANQRPH
jgi:hypothetical protein